VGEHEAHVCQYVSLMLNSVTDPRSAFKMRFVGCKEFNSEVDK